MSKSWAILQGRLCSASQWAFWQSLLQYSGTAEAGRNLQHPVHLKLAVELPQLEQSGMVLFNR